MVKERYDEITATQVWNALSNGVVPHMVMESLFIGRSKEIEILETMLEEAKTKDISGLKFVQGVYGQGKTMILRKFSSMAIEKGFVVARLQLGAHNNLSKPEILYRDIMQHLEVLPKERKNPSIDDLNEYEGAEFEDLFEAWLKTIKNSNDMNEASKKVYEVINIMQEYQPTFSSLLLVYIRALINNDIQKASIAAAWIKGDYNLPYEEKKKLGIKGSVDRHNAFDILRGFTRLVTLLGYSGLVITIDELEWIANERSDIRKRSYTVLRQIIDEIGMNAWHNTVIIGAHTPEMIENKEKGFKSYEALYQRLENGIEGGNFTANMGNTLLTLQRLREEEFRDIGKKMQEIHQKKNAYEAKVNYNILVDLGMAECKKEEMKNATDITIRSFVKKMVQLIELSYEQPELPIFKINAAKYK